MTGRRDALVIGGGVSGLIAAAYLARHRLQVLVLDAEPEQGMHRSAAVADDSFYALDPIVLAELHLDVRYRVRDLPLVILRPERPHLVISRDVYRTARNLAEISASDADAWPQFRRDTYSLARSMRSLWWPADLGASVSISGAYRELLDSSRFAGASAWLANWFEADAIRAALAFDGTDGGASVCAPPSALVLLWRAAQEMSGLQGASAVVEGGMRTLQIAAERAARTAGVEVRGDARVTKIFSQNARARGVELSSGEQIEASIVLSSLPYAATRDLVPRGSFGLVPAVGSAETSVGEARVELMLDRAADFGGPASGRLIVCDGVESMIEAHEAARAGQIPNEICFDAIAFPFDPAGTSSTLSICVRPVPIAPAMGWERARQELVAKVVAMLCRYDRKLREKISGLRIETPADFVRGHGSLGAPVTLERLLAPPRRRIATPLEGLFLCGRDAEPVGALSGRAARLAARLAAVSNAAAESASR